MKNKAIYSILLFSILLLSLNQGCKKEKMIVVPTVVIANVSDITSTSATCMGEIRSDGGSPILEMGICWSLTSPLPTISDNKTTEVISNGSFTSSITGLAPGVTYYFRAYATNGAGTAYSSQVTFAALTTAPVLTTSELLSITAISVSCGGHIIADGGMSILSHGVCWSTNQNPTIADHKLSNTQEDSSFTSHITGLKPNTTYYLRAYATNYKETGYGNELTFKTLASGIGPVTDIDGNVYNTVIIGTQVWMVENLQTTRYNDGTPIPQDTVWFNLRTEAYCWYDNDIANKNVYGALYNWFAVHTEKLCPQGWHVPSDEEWTTLTNFLGKANVAGGQMKEAGTTHWMSPNNGTNPEVGFNAVPGGYRGSNGKFQYLYYRCNYWSSTQILDSPTTVWDRNLKNVDTSVYAGAMAMNYGCSVRCIKD
ncbi:MAG TPA: FISUMP domain-containing protein [Prolixibacteraceae bacterium]|jgi:uncharacterized protein (TIGR02145 family)